MKIIMDGLGGDSAPDEVLEGARLAVKEYGVEILITGDKEKLRTAAYEKSVPLDGIEILEADGALTMEDAPTEVLRGKKNCSMAVGLRALADGRGDAFVSAGNTGALVVGSRSIVGCMDGLRRPALAPILPHTTGCFMLLDGGANVECRPEMLLQFGHMGAVYMEKILSIQNPRVGLANIGAEEHKGTQLQQDAYALLKESSLRFVGNVEGRDIPFGVCDVLVADGFTGNIILKLIEGMGLFMGQTIKGMFTRNALTMGAALVLKPALEGFKKKMDYTEYGGAPLMGLKKPVFKAHGSSNAHAFQNAVRQAVAFVKEDVIAEIEGIRPQASSAG